MTTTTKAKTGFYANGTDTCYVTPAGRVYLVATDDLVDLPAPELLDMLPDGCEPCDSLITPGEAVEWVKAVEAESGESLLETA